ncbi:hypothetical protein OIU76_026806 [Salix suchowensis]|nr:hypothetical protein OIU76_026806 [Salix suchowensis]
MQQCSLPSWSSRG